jgi:hypothetical protein
MAIKIHGKLRGQSPGEQLKLERKRFKARQERRKRVVSEKLGLKKEKPSDVAPYPID